jgi:hypothetical protein
MIFLFLKLILGFGIFESNSISRPIYSKLEFIEKQ